MIRTILAFLIAGLIGSGAVNVLFPSAPARGFAAAGYRGWDVGAGRQPTGPRKLDGR